MTRNEAIEILESVSFFAPSDIDVDTALDMAIKSLKAWDEVIHSLNCLDRLEYTDCDKSFNVYPKSNVDAIINKYMKEVEDDKR